MFFLNSPQGMDVSFQQEEQEMVSSGDVLYFPSCTTVHRGVPVSEKEEVWDFFFIFHFLISLQQRKLLFWYSWEKGSQSSPPDADFQLNPWTFAHLIAEDVTSLVCI